MSQAPQTGKKIQNYVFNYADFLGSGNFSKCYKATNITTQEKVAIKIVELNSLKSKKLEELLFSEIAVLKQLNHPNVLRCIEVFTSNRNCYIITEVCEEGDLEDRVKKGGQLEEREIQKVIGDVYSGLLYLSSKGVVHRDLKIANIFMKDGVAKIADFGFAVYSNKLFKDMNIGSPLYMSPEGFLNNTYGPKTDVWSFGVMIYELYHKKTPFCSCKTEKELKKSIITPIQYNELKSSIPEEAKQLILSCLQISEEKRPAVKDLQNLMYLRSALRGESIKSPTSLKMQAPSQLAPSSNRLNFEPNSFGRNRNNHPKVQNLFQSEDHSRRFTSPQKTMVIPTAPLNNSIEFRSQGPRAARNQSSQHALPNNTFSFNFQSPQVKRTRVQDRKNMNESVQLSPEPRRVMNTVENNSSRQIINQMPVQKARLVNCQLNFKESVSILHYCRLIFKYLELYQGIIGTRDMSSNKHYCLLSQFLMQILDEMYQDIINKRVRYDGQNMEMREKKLIQVTSQYLRKYSSELGQHNFKAGLSDHEKRGLSITRFKDIAESAVSGSILGQQCSNEEAIAGQLLLSIYSATILLDYSFKRRSFTAFQKNRQIEDILNRNKANFTFSSYLDHRNKVFNLPRA